MKHIYRIISTVHRQTTSPCYNMGRNSHKSDPVGKWHPFVQSEFGESEFFSWEKNSDWSEFRLAESVSNFSRKCVMDTPYLTLKLLHAHLNLWFNGALQPSPRH